MAELIVTTLVGELDTGAAIEAPGGDGLSLREAIGLAANGDTVVFQDGLGGTIRIDESFDAIAIAANIKIYGDDRITISGDSAGDDTVVNGFTDLALTAANELDDNQKIFGLNSGLTDVVLDGLTLTGGRGGGYGGAIDTFSSDLTVAGSTFAGNVVYGGFGGGAIFSNSGSLSVVNSTFVGKHALLGDSSGSPSGGAIFSNGTAVGATYLNNVTMTGNYAEFQGGGLYANNISGQVVITNSLILGNRANVTAMVSGTKSTAIVFPHSTSLETLPMATTRRMSSPRPKQSMAASQAFWRIMRGRCRPSRCWGRRYARRWTR